MTNSPKVWQWLNLGKLLVENPCNGLYKSSDFIGQGTLFLDINGLYRGLTADFSEARKIELTKSEYEKYKLTEGDILFNRVSKKPEGVGKAVFVYKLNEPAVFESNMIRIRLDKERIYPNFIVYYLSSNQSRQELLSKANIANQASINQTAIKSLKIPVLPLEEQRRIAAILDKADEVRRKRQEAIRLTEELLRSLFLDMFGDPSKFQLVELEKLASKEKHSLSSGPFGSNLTSSHYVDEGFLVLRGKNITSGKIDLSDSKYVSKEKYLDLARSAVKANDVVVVAVGASGTALSLPDGFPEAVMSQNFNKITPDPSKVESIYLAYAINSSFVQRQLVQNITDTVRTFLSLTKLRKIQIPLPHIDTQRRFVNFVKQIEFNQKRYVEATDKADNLFNSLLQRAFRGEL